MTNEALIRNYQLTRNVLAGQDLLVNHYKLKGSTILLIQELCMLHNSFKAYIEFKRSDLDLYMSNKCFYRAIHNLVEKEIITLIDHSMNGKQTYKLYFTTQFIRTVCDEEFADLYEDWLEQVKEN